MGVARVKDGTNRSQETAKIAFEAYNAQGPNAGLAHDGRKVPGWDEIAPDKREQIHLKWRAAVAATAREVVREMVLLLSAGCPPDEIESAVLEAFHPHPDAPAIREG